MTFLRLRNVRIFRDMPTIADLGGIPPGLSAAAPGQIEHLISATDRAITSSLDAERRSETMQVCNPHPLFKLLRDLDEASIQYTIHRDRSDTIRINLTLVGQRVEVDVFEDGHMEVARFRGSEDVEGDAILIESIIADNRE